MILVFVLNALVSGIRIGCLLFLLNLFAELKKPDLKKLFLCLGGGVFVNLGVGVLATEALNEDIWNNIAISPIGSSLLLEKIMLELVVVGLFVALEDRRKVRNSMAVACYFQMIFWFWTFVISVGLDVAANSAAFVQNSNWQGQLGNWIMSVVVLVVTVLLIKKKNSNRRKLIKLYTYVAMLGMFAVISMEGMNIVEITTDTRYMWMIIAMVILSGVIGIVMLEVNSAYEKEKELVQLKSDQAKLLEQEYTSLNNTYTVNAKLFHDLHNHIGTLRYLLNNEKYKAAVEYLDELQAPVKEMTEKKWTGDDTIDYLINSKFVRAQEHSIKLEVHVEFPKYTNIKGADLSAIIGNLLDNAIEAAKQVNEEANRFVKLTIRRINQMLVIKVENSFATELVEKDGQLQTTKTEGGLHGWGIKSARTAAEKYDGTVMTSTDEGVFKAVATLSFEGVEI